MGEDDVEFRRKVAWAYVEGLCWVLKYYYQVSRGRGNRSGSPAMSLFPGVRQLGLVLSLSLRSVCKRFRHDRPVYAGLLAPDETVQATGAADECVPGSQQVLSAS